MYRISILLFSILLIVGCATIPAPTETSAAAANYGAAPVNYEQTIKGLVSANLFDPYSAVYTFSTPQKGWNTMTGEIVWGWCTCGSINAKNRMGGYTGAKPFYAMFYDERLIIFIYEGITIPDSFKLGLISGQMTLRGSSDYLCR